MITGSERHNERAQAYLESAQNAQRMLSDELAKPTYSSQVLTQLRSEVTFAMSAAKVEAQLAAAEALIEELSALRSQIKPDPNAARVVHL